MTSLAEQTLAAPLTEAQFMRQVTELAEIRGWSWAHFRPAMTSKGWRTPVSGPLGKGWPDLVLVRKGRILFVELKADGGSATPDQSRVLETLMQTEHYRRNHPDDCTDVRVELWRPVDWALVEDTLR
jgi:hypothetical protein